MPAETISVPDAETGIDILKVWQEYQIELLWEEAFPDADPAVFFDTLDLIAH